MVVVEDAIKLLDALDPKAILQLSGSNNVNAFILFNMLSSTNEDVPLLQSRSDWKARGAVLDRWGSPIRIKVTILRENPRITSIELRSIGPNKLDENGLGDDIVNPEFVLKGVTH
ncbi:MAG TPA: hypothetical protein VFV96_14075 [Verrucomicrobiae bacterium]|nr:hypothetical protein [Verrucomicrobiae bacterium]